MPHRWTPDAEAEAFAGDIARRAVQAVGDVRLDGPPHVVVEQRTDIAAGLRPSPIVAALVARAPGRRRCRWAGSTRSLPLSSRRSVGPSCSSPTVSPATRFCRLSVACGRTPSWSTPASSVTAPPGQRSGRSATAPRPRRPPPNCCSRTRLSATNRRSIMGPWGSTTRTGRGASWRRRCRTAAALEVDPWERGDPRYRRDGRAPGSPSWNAGGDGPAWSRKRQPFEAPDRRQGGGAARCPTPSCTATPTSRSSTVHRIPRSSSPRQPDSVSKRSPSPTTTASTASSASQKRHASWGCRRSSARS